MEFAQGFHPPKTTTSDCSRKNKVHINRVPVHSVHARESNLGQQGDARFGRSNVERSALANERNKPLEQSTPNFAFSSEELFDGVVTTGMCQIARYQPGSALWALPARPRRSPMLPC